VLHLDEDRIARVLRYEWLIPAMEKALADFSSGQVIQPVRSMIVIEEGKRYLGIMPAVAANAMGAKLVSFYPANAGTGIPTHMGLIMLFRPDTGEPLALLDGRLITEMRTAAVSAAVTKHVAGPESRILALLGSGVQAKAHLDALSQVRDFDEVRVWSRMPEHAKRFAEQNNARAMDAEAAVRGADIVVTATNARDPILKGAWVKPGAHINGIGSPRPDWRELDDEVMRSGTLIVDSREAAVKECGDVILSNAPIYAEAGEIFAGTKAIPPGKTTVFRSVGIAIEDIAAARLVYDACAEEHDRV
jgi:thiomorpholine-carboxylate dehydrogenase